jgi:hypothetical protein
MGDTRDKDAGAAGKPASCLNPLQGGGKAGGGAN